ncbi:hypothetical protein [Pedobacter xixiisoli]|uniref:Uncharacterized protein n=1 Tax=Pedobacter xixiisoli TaxID=1476464 RepID=A0A285ZSU2_9SPHI|nr:hypothetical protein [Pedobacter xixiisoli]SOD12730.1 hypothetical protein SAMN06297358_0818 [Pedobacter xixiisoli]
MENDKTLVSDQLILSKYCFDKLLKAIMNKFNNKHKVDFISDSQLFGFANYDPLKPSLKNEFEQITKGYINGKYLYTKNRELKQGKPIIRLNREYKYAFLNYLNYDRIESFLENEIFDELEMKAQLALIETAQSNEDFYYCCYYYGEDQKMNKGKLTIYNNWSNMEFRFVYFDENDIKSEYVFYGDIKISEDLMFMHTKYVSNNIKKEGANFVFFVGKSTSTERNYLIGTYSGFDKYNRTIAGKIILKKFASKTEMENEFSTRQINPLLTQELKGKRIIIESHLPSISSKISNTSPFASLFSNLSGDYQFKFHGDSEDFHTLELSIDSLNYNISSKNPDVIIENDIVKLINRGQNAYLDFEVLGVSYIQKVSIYIKMYYLIKPENDFSGVYSGVDFNNNPINGNVEIKYSKQS